MGSCGLTVDSWEGLTEPSDLHKMTPFVILSLVASAFAAPQLPAGLTAAACPNYPYCDATGGFLAVPDVPGAADVIAAQEAIIRSHQGVGVPALPGFEAHAAAEAAVQQQSRAGFPDIHLPAHAAAVNAVLLSQGRLPEGLDAGHVAHYIA